MKRYWRKNESVGGGQWAVGKVSGDFLSLVANCLLLIAYGILLIAYSLLASCSPNKHVHAEQYTCPMHPTVVQDKPGACPVCGMDLVIKGKHSEATKISDELDYLLKPVNSTVISSIKTVSPERKSMDIRANANGIIAYDTRALTTIASRFNGRIERLFVKYNFQPIHKGEKILEIYSPELITAQRDLLYLLKSDKENLQLIDGAKEKLRLLGVSEAQINQLILDKKETNSSSVYSSADGYISNTGENLTSQTELAVREGMYVSAGQIVFKVVNPKNVWAEFDIYSNDAALVKINDPLQIKFTESGEALEGRVNFVQPFYKNGQSFMKVRVYLSNSNGKYQRGQLITASFNSTSQDSWWLPLSSRLSLGTKTIVFVKKDGIFQPREITTGHQSGNWIEVLKGIAATDSIAYNAHFMIDSESFIKIYNHEK
jgi:Cu(I)/Ag(I) efflux system membrane fusion protein